MPPSRTLALPALLAAALLLGGRDRTTDSPTTAATPTSTAVTAVTATATPSATSTSTATATEPPAATGTATPSASPTSEASATPTAATTPTPTPDEPVASTASIPTAELPITRFTRGDGAPVDLPTEALPLSEYGIGLSGRYELEGRGMLFYYPDESGGPGFWMRNTHIDLDIAFVAGDGTIITIIRMTADTDDVHHPRRAYLAGIEAPAGWFAANGIEAGDHVEFLFEPEEYLE